MKVERVMIYLLIFYTEIVYKVAYCEGVMTYNLSGIFNAADKIESDL